MIGKKLNYYAYCDKCKISFKESTDAMLKLCIKLQEKGWRDLNGKTLCKKCLKKAKIK